MTMRATLRLLSCMATSLVLRNARSCGRTAAFSLRIAASEAQELVGGSDSYRPVCRRCYLEAQLKARQACL